MAADPEPDYPQRWEADVALSDGGTMSVRPIRPDDAERIVEFHERQSPESIYFRFFSPRPRLSERDVDRFTHVDYVDRMAFIGLIGEELVGVARYDRHRARSDAEVAFFIDDQHHGRGMATVLLEYLAAAAREAGISGFTASVLPQNRKMLGVFTQAGFTASSHYADGVIEVELGIEPTAEALAAIEARAATAEARSVERILRPSSIAVVGASRQPGTIGYQVFHQLVSHGFNGPVYPINPEATYVASVRAWRSVLDVPGELDLVVICVPSEQVLRVVEECAIKRVQALVVLSSGFADRDEAGEEAEARLVSYARRHGMRLIGPNALGVLNTDPDVRMHAMFVGVDPIPGRIGLVAQSGVIGAAIVDGARHLGLGISSFVAVGNKADVSSNDLLRYWRDDDCTDVVMCYLESFGNPSKFTRTARDLSSVKPVVAVKVGGAAGDHWEEPADWPHDATSAALLEQTGIVRVDNLTQMFHTAGVLAHQPLPAGPRVAVVTNSWGPAWLAVDALKAAGLQPADPVDLSNEAQPEQFYDALVSVYADPSVDAVLAIYAPAVTTHYRKVGAAIRRASAREGSVTTVACLLGQHGPSTLADDDHRVPQFPFPEEAALALGRVAAHAAWREQPVGTFASVDGDAVTEARTMVDGWMGPIGPGERRWLDPRQAAKLLAAVGLRLPVAELVDDLDSAIGAAGRIGYPIALKASGLDRLAKTEAGGVALDVHGEDEVRDAYGRMEALLGAAMHPAVVQEMVPGGVECNIGIHRHPVLGDVVTLGPGGAGAEQVTGSAMRLLPMSDADAGRLIDASPLATVLADPQPGRDPEREREPEADSDPEAEAEAGPEAGAEAEFEHVSEPGLASAPQPGSAPEPEPAPAPTSRRQGLVDLLVRLGALADALPEVATVRLDPVLLVEGSAAITDVRIGLTPVVADTRPPVRRL